VFAGVFNGLLLPGGIGVLVWVAWRRTDLLNGTATGLVAGARRCGVAAHRLPGGAAWLPRIYLAVRSVRPVIDLFG
jgi:hypothetical protein